MSVIQQGIKQTREHEWTEKKTEDACLTEVNSCNTRVIPRLWKQRYGIEWVLMPMRTEV